MMSLVQLASQVYTNEHEIYKEHPVNCQGAEMLFILPY